MAVDIAFLTGSDPIFSMRRRMALLYTNSWSNSQYIRSKTTVATTLYDLYHRMYHFGATESQRANFQRVFDKHCQKATGCWTTSCLKEYLRVHRSPGQDISDDCVQLLWRIVVQFAYFPFQPPVGFLWLDFEALFRAVTWLSDSEYVMPGRFTRALTSTELESKNAALTPETPGALFRIDGTLLRSPHNGRTNVRAGLTAQDYRRLVFIALSTTDAGPGQSLKSGTSEDCPEGFTDVLDVMMWLQPMASTSRSICTEPRESFTFRTSNLPRLPSTKELELTDDRRRSLVQGLSILQHDNAIDIEDQVAKRASWTWEDFDASLKDTTPCLLKTFEPIFSPFFQDKTE